MSSMLLLGALGFAQTPVGVDAPPTLAPRLAVPQLRVLLPDARLPVRRALTVVDRIVAIHGDRLDVVLVWPRADAASRCGRRGPPGTRALVDAAGAMRESLAPGAPSDTALAAWSDRVGGLALIGPLDDGALEVAAAAAAGRPIEDLARPAIDAVRAGTSLAGVRAVVDEAVLDLADRPVDLARVLDAAVAFVPAIAVDPRVRSVADDLYRDRTRSEVTQRLAFVVRHAAGDVAGARQAGFGWIESVKGRGLAARALIDSVRARNGERVYDEVLELAFDVALGAAPDDASLARIVFEQRVDRNVDRIGAERAGRAYVDAVGADAATLNSFAWKLLTESPYAREFDALALHAARAMSEDPEWRTYWRIDTHALACFRNGMLAEAVAMQREAMANADPSSRQRYQQRLEDYTAAAMTAAAPGGSR